MSELERAELARLRQAVSRYPAPVVAVNWGYYCLSCDVAHHYGTTGPPFEHRPACLWRQLQETAGTWSR